MRLHECSGGRGGIRTHGTLAGTPVFKTGALNHSATLPLQRYQPLSGRKIKNGLDQTGARRLFGHVIRRVFASWLKKPGRKGGEGVADVLVGLLGGFPLDVNSMHEIVTDLLGNDVTLCGLHGRQFDIVCRVPYVTSTS